MHLEEMTPALIRNMVVLYVAVPASFLAMLGWFLQKRRRLRGMKTAEPLPPGVPHYPHETARLFMSADAAAFFLGIVAAVQLFRFFPLFGVIYTVVYITLFVGIYFYKEKGL